MSERIPEELLERFSETVSTQMGLFFPRERWRDLERGAISAAREMGFEDAAACLKSLLVSSISPFQTKILARHLTIGETYFMREKQALNILRNSVFPELIEPRRRKAQRLRIWSAGCSTGEEAFSIAILLCEMLPDLGQWNITILGTDLNPHSLKKASEGIYTEWSFRDTPAWLKEKYFTKIGEGYKIDARIQKMVNFSYLNLVEDVYPSLLNNTNAMDVILCRNVLMYFNRDTSRKVAEKFHLCVVEGGYFVTSPVEFLHVEIPAFEQVRHPGVALFRKPGKPLRPPTPPFEFPKPEPELEIPPQAESFEEFTPLGLGFRENPASEASKPPEQILNFQEQIKTLYELGDFQAAAQRAEVLLKQFPTDAALLEWVTRARANQGKLDEALQWCEKAINADRIQPVFHFLRGAILQEQGKMQPARESLRRVIFLDPDFVLAHFALGNLFHHEGQENQAQGHFQNAFNLVRRLPPETILPESEGLTAGRLREILQTNLLDEEIRR
jgi:chemotaxis protein methyltransferase CheR